MVQARAVSTRREVVLSAARAFDLYGYANTSISDISRSAGVSNGALYFHFRSKDALATAVRAAAWESSGPLVRAAAQPGAGLRNLVETSCRLADLLREDVVVRAGYRLACETDRVGSLIHRLWFRHVRRLLEQARQERALPPDVVVDALATSATAMCVGIELLGRQDPDWLRGEVVARCWAGLLGEQRSGLQD